MSAPQGLSPQGHSKPRVLEAPYSFIGNPHISRAGTTIFIQSANGFTFDIFHARHEMAVAIAQEFVDDLNTAADLRNRILATITEIQGLRIQEVSRG